MRLDNYLVKYKKIQSRNKAIELIKSNKILVNSILISKPSYNVDINCKIDIQENSLYVSRSAYKLKYFLNELNLNLQNKLALDIGSSTGGFTQILLENNIKHIICIDIGSNQLHQYLRYLHKIKLYENQDIRDFKSKIKFDIITCDVSFISLNNILDYINNLLFEGIIILFKPQFEVGKNIKRDKKGVVLDEIAIKKSKLNFIDKTKKLKWKLEFRQISQIKGKNGNDEELFYFKK
jgi:23S rRNA (cytidine1920-2'-O)/16S rRNA (cytidine1409-2'-O)-methyltransferase